MLNTNNIKDVVKSQFPEFYEEYGPLFIEFIKCYYTWLEQNKYSGPSRNIPASLDIDTTEEAFLEYFKSEYMSTLPKKLLGDQRFLQKHILDLYRAKGSHEGLRLLFRLLYNKEIDIYIPGKDIFKLSNGKWIQRKYMEVSDELLNSSFIYKDITGEISGATAYVEGYDRIIYNGKRNAIFWISHISGEFRQNEKIFKDISEINSSPTILGSLVDLDITFSSNGLTKGQIFYSTTDPELKFVVSSINTNEEVGVIAPEILDGGGGYREANSTVTITKRGANGQFAEFIVGPVIPNLYLDVSSVLISPYANTDLNVADFGMPGTSPANTTTNIQSALEFENVGVGPITSLTTINPGELYDDAVDIYAVDDDILDMAIPDDSGGLLGNNAVIVGYPAFGTNKAQTVDVITSLFNFNDGEQIILTDGAGKTITGTAVTGAVGQIEGYYRDTNSFLSNEKYLQDSYYYQEYSYDIRTDERFDDYENVLKNTVHPSGKKAFGNMRNITQITASNSTISTIISENQ